MTSNYEDGDRSYGQVLIKFSKKKGSNFGTDISDNKVRC